MNLTDTSYLTFALPNKGRLKEPAINLLKKAGYAFRVKDRSLYATCTNAEIVFVFLRTDDIPSLVHTGTIDLGITGEDLVVEANATSAKELLPLGFGKCRLAVACRDTAPDDVTHLAGKTIATSFPNITKRFFASEGVSIECLTMSGALEITIGLRLADAIVDIVETGDTLRSNNLKVVRDIESYQAALIANERVMTDARVLRIKRRLEGLLIAERYSLLEYNIKKSALKDAEAITPGYESPTVSTLDEENWVAVKVMVEKKHVVEAMDKLEELGATAIIETEIKNCRL